MAANMEFHKPEFEGEASRTSTGPVSQGHDEHVANIDDGGISPSHANHTSRNDVDADNGRDSPVTRSESTARGDEDDRPRTTSAPSNKLENVPTARDWGNSVDNTPAKGQKHRKIYVHNRHTKALTKNFTAGSAFSHLPFLNRHSHSKEKKAEDPEHQGEIHKNVTVWHNFWIMLTTFPYWNMAFWSGWCYSIGSALFIVSSCISWVPLAYPDIVYSDTLDTYGSPLSFFFGACLYQIGGVMAYLEAVNDGCFAGAAMKRLLEGHQDIEKELLDAKLHRFFGHLVPHHHHEDDDDNNHNGDSVDEGANNWDSIANSNSRPEDVYDEAKERVERREGVDHGSASAQQQQGEVREYLVWRWWPTWHSLIHYHIFELGYVACAIQLFGVTLFGVTSVVILPGIYDSLKQWQLVAAYWVPQTVASCCFIIASIMFTIMAQERWNKPKWAAVSWWIGIHAFIGSCGFLLIAIFGFYGHDHTWAEYQSSLSSIWGSFFYMLSGLCQWYEAINDNAGPVLAFPNQRVPVLMRPSRKKEGNQVS